MPSPKTIKKLLLLIFLFAVPAFSQSPKSVTSSVAFQDPQGNPLVNGVLVMDLSQPATITGSGGQVAPIRVIINLDATGKIPAGIALWASDQLTPTGTSYLVQIENSLGSVVSNLRPCPWVLTGTAPIDLSIMTCTSIGATYPLAGGTGPTGPPGPTGATGATGATGPAGSGSGWTHEVDCATFTGADLGAKINACYAASPTGSILSLLNFASPQTLSTAVTFSKSVMLYVGGLNITQSAAIAIQADGVSIVCDPSTTSGYFLKSGNIDQITIQASNDKVIGCWMRGNQSGGSTGSEIVVTSGADKFTLDNDRFSDNAANAIKTGTASGSIINCTSDSPGGVLISATSTNLKMSNNRFLNTVAATDVMDIIGGTVEMDQTIFTRDNATSSATVINLTSSAVLNASQVYITGNGLSTNANLSAAALKGCSGCVINFSQGTILAGSGWPAIDGYNLTLTNNLNLNGGGANGAGIISEGGAANILGNTSMSFGAGSDGITLVNSSGGSISNNSGIVLSVTSQSGVTGIKLSSSSISTVINNNSVTLSGAPSADVYGIAIVTDVSNHMSGNHIEGNVISGGNNAFQTGIKFDNSSGGGGANFSSFNWIGRNTCTDLNRCIVRIDSGNANSQFYENNLAYATPTLMDTGGSTLDIVTQTETSFTFATLPIAGNGSIVSCSDCQIGISSGASGRPILVSRQNGNWIGMGNGPVCKNITPVTVSTNTTSDQNLLQCSLPTNIMHYVGATMKIYLKGVYSTPVGSTATLNLKVKFCLNSGCAADPFPFTVLSITSSANPGTITNNPLFLDSKIVTQSVPSGNVYEVSGMMSIDLGAATTSALSLFGDTNTAVTGTDLSTDVFILTTGAFSSGSASNSITARQLIVSLE